MTTLTRRQALAAAASTTLLSACTMRPPGRIASVATASPRINEAQATALLDSVAANLLAVGPGVVAARTRPATMLRAE